MRLVSLAGSRSLLFFFKDPATTDIYTLSLHDALPISPCLRSRCGRPPRTARPAAAAPAHRTARSEEHTSELQSHVNLVCRLLLEKKKSSATLQRCSMPPSPLATPVLTRSILRGVLVLL